jgi:hypothetical protein
MPAGTLAGERVVVVVVVVVVAAAGSVVAVVAGMAVLPMMHNLERS